MTSVATGQRAKACVHAAKLAACELSKEFDQYFIVGVTKDTNGFLYSWIGDVDFELKKQVLLELEGKLSV